MELHNLREHFGGLGDALHKAVVELGGKNTIFQDKPEKKSERDLLDEWKGKALHGRYFENLRAGTIDQEASNTYLRVGYLFPETEGMIVSIQDQEVNTRAYQSRIIGLNIPSESCRLCNGATESIQHIVAGCSSLAGREYLDRHNAVAKVIHQGLCLSSGLIEHLKQPHKYVPQWSLDNQKVKIYWDTTIRTDRTIVHNRPDILFINKPTKEAFLLDIATPLDENVHKTYLEKISKYEDLAYEIKDLWRLKRVTILPFIISANGLVHKNFLSNLKTLELDYTYLVECQKAVILGTCRIVRKVLHR